MRDGAWTMVHGREAEPEPETFSNNTERGVSVACPGVGERRGRGAMGTCIWQSIGVQ